MSLVVKENNKWTYLVIHVILVKLTFVDLIFASHFRFRPYKKNVPFTRVLHICFNLSRHFSLVPAVKFRGSTTTSTTATATATTIAQSQTEDIKTKSTTPRATEEPPSSIHPRRNQLQQWVSIARNNRHMAKHASLV